MYYNIFVERGRTFEKEGRIHNLDQSIELDHTIKEDLYKYGVNVHDFSQKDMSIAVKECIKDWQLSKELIKRDPNKYVIVQNKGQDNTMRKYFSLENISISPTQAFTSQFVYKIDLNKKIATPVLLTDIIQDSNKKLQSVNMFMGIKKIPKQSLEDRIKNAGEKCRKSDESHNVKDKCKIEEVQSI